MDSTRDIARTLASYFVAVYEAGGYIQVPSDEVLDFIEKLAANNIVFEYNPQPAKKKS